MPNLPTEEDYTATEQPSQRGIDSTTRGKANPALTFDDLVGLNLGDPFDEDADQNLSRSIQEAVARRDWDASSFARIKQEESAGYYYDWRPKAPFAGHGNGDLCRKSIRWYRNSYSVEDILHETIGTKSHGTPLSAIVPSPLRKIKSVDDLSPETLPQNQWSEHDGSNDNDDDEDGYGGDDEAWFSNSEIGKCAENSLSTEYAQKQINADDAEDDSDTSAGLDSTEGLTTVPSSRDAADPDLVGTVRFNIRNLGSSNDCDSQVPGMLDGNESLGSFDPSMDDHSPIEDGLKVTPSRLSESKGLPLTSGFFDSDGTSDVSDEPSTPESAQELEWMTGMPIDENEREQRIQQLSQRVMTENLEPNEELQIKRQMLAYSQAAFDEDHPEKNIEIKAGMNQDPRITGTWAAAAAHMYRSQRDQAFYERDKLSYEVERLKQANYEQEFQARSWQARAQTWMGAAKMHQQSYEAIREKGMLWIRREETIQRGDGIRHVETQTEDIDVRSAETQTSTPEEFSTEGSKSGITMPKGELFSDSTEPNTKTTSNHIHNELMNLNNESEADVRSDKEPQTSISKPTYPANGDNSEIPQPIVDYSAWCELNEKNVAFNHENEELLRKLEDLGKQNKSLSQDLHLAQTKCERSQGDGQPPINSPTSDQPRAKPNMEESELHALLPKNPRWIERERRIRNSEQYKRDRETILQKIKRHGVKWLANELKTASSTVELEERG